MVNSKLMDDIKEEKQKKVKIVLDRVVEIIKDPEFLENTLIGLDYYRDDKLKQILAYANVCLLIVEVKELYPEIDWEEISYQYMIKIRSGIYSTPEMSHTGLFGGFSSIGFGARALSINASYYNKFLNGLNQLIVNKVKENLNIYKNNIGNVKIESYDLIFGLSGTAAYLLLFKEDKEIEDTIKEILKYLVKITEDINIQGIIVPGWYTSCDNQFTDTDKLRYKNGNFNLGISHGITGPLAVMSIAIKEGIEVEGQRESIKKILRELKRLYIVDEDGFIQWPGRINFDNYIVNKVGEDFYIRGSWCYGVPGIARAIYLAGTVVKDNESIELALKVIEEICEMPIEKWGFNSPTFCHGYAGLLAIVQAMYKDTSNNIFDEGRKRIERIILEYYDDKFVFGFYNIEPNPFNKEYEPIQTNRIDIIEGTIGILLAVLSTTQPIKSNWTRMFALD